MAVVQKRRRTALLDALRLLVSTDLTLDFIGGSLEVADEPRLDRGTSLDTCLVGDGGGGVCSTNGVLTN
jgi:hypothetical protein